MDQALYELLREELAETLDAEWQLRKALPDLAKAAQSEELREALASQRRETDAHITRLQGLADSLKAPAKQCPAMVALLRDGQQSLEENDGSPALDAILIAAQQKAMHYKIASYASLCAWAELLGQEDALGSLKAMLEEERAADAKLMVIASSIASAKAEAVW